MDKQDTAPLDESSKDSELQLFAVPITVDFDVLREENADIIAWLYCPNTSINYPVVQSSDNDYYLRRLLDGSYNTAGTFFADYRNAGDFSGWTSLIYGHNMKNDTMFGTLPDYRVQDYFDAHPVMYLLTPAQDYRIDLLDGYVTSDDAPFYNAAGTKEERDTLLDAVSRKSEVVTGVEVSDTDRIITLSTCSYEHENARYVLIGVLKELSQ